MKIALDGQQFCTVLAALRFYEQQGMGEPSNRTDDIHCLATDNDNETSLDSVAIMKLFNDLRATVPNEKAVEEIVFMVKEGGLDSSDLDDAVHDAASLLATNANNGDIEGQVAFLVELYGKDGAIADLRGYSLLN